MDGQEVYYAADAANGVNWHLRYRAGANGPYKWEFLGGSDLYGFVNAICQRAGPFGYADPSSGPAGPFFNIPLAGDFLVNLSARMVQGSAAVTGQAGIRIGAVDPPSGYEIVFNSGGGAVLDITMDRQVVMNVPTAGLEARMVFSVPASGTVSWYSKWLQMRPIRVG